MDDCRFRRNTEPVALLLLRLVVGTIMAVHGWQKLGNVEGFASGLTGMGVPYPTVAAWLAVAGEFLGGLGLIVGFLTPVAAFGIFCTMAVAVFKVHWASGLLAKDNGFEYPLTLMTVALFFMIRGAGCISLDAVFFCRKKGNSAA